MRFGRHKLLTKVPLTGTWFRAVRQHHFATALDYGHTISAPGRFNPGTGQHPGFPVLYLAEDQHLCLLEVSALFGVRGDERQVVANPRAGVWTVFPVRVQLSRVVDLSDPSQLQLLDTSVQELTGDWFGYLSRSLPGHTETAPT